VFEVEAGKINGIRLSNRVWFLAPGYELRADGNVSKADQVVGAGT
jgi:hypothetical protein